MSAPVNRNYVILGAVTLAFVLGLLWLAGNVGALRRADGQRYTLALDDGAGVSVGSPIRLAGVEVGRVEAIEASASQSILTLVLDPAVEVHVDASAGPRAKSLLGQKYVELRPGSEDAPRLPVGEAIATSWGSYEVDEALNALEPVLGASGSLASALDAFAPLLARLETDATDEVPAQTDEDPKTGDTGDTEDLAAEVDELRESITQTRELVESGRDELPELLSNANELLSGREIDRTLGTLDRVTASTARELPGLFDEGERALGRADSALAKVEDFGRSVTAERVAELDGLLGDVAKASAEARDQSAELQGLGDEVGPLIDKLALISRRAAAIDELTIRRFLQEEGFLIRVGGGERKQAHERLDDLGD